MKHYKYIIGMMNTADRSLAMIDYAPRRRFSFFRMEPGVYSEGFKAYQATLHNNIFNTLIERIVELNHEIKNDDSLGMASVSDIAIIVFRCCRNTGLMTNRRCGIGKMC